MIKTQLNILMNMIMIRKSWKILNKSTKSWKNPKYIQNMNKIVHQHIVTSSLTSKQS